MAFASAPDGVRLYYEQAGSGTPIVFVHEFAGDCRSWEPQVRFLSRRYRCVTFNARGYPPSEVPTAGAAYSQSAARDDVIALMDHLGLDRAHVVGHSMGAYTALHVGLDHPHRCGSLTIAGCGWGSDPAMRGEAERMGRAVVAMFRRDGIAAAAEAYAKLPVRLPFRHKDPRGWAEFARFLSEHSAEGHALTMENLQLRRPTLQDMAERLKAMTLPMLVVTGDEDDWCVTGSLLLKRTVPRAGLLVLPGAGHTINSEEPDAFNRALGDFLAAAEAGRWMAHARTNVTPP